MAGRLLPPLKRESHLEAALLAQIALARLPSPEREVRLVEGRRFRTDFYFPTARLAVEVDGGVWSGGKSRHTSGAGYTRDCEKINLITLQGIRVLRVTAEHIRTGQALQWIEQGLSDSQREAQP